jgi:hypothetical protein
MGLVSSLRPRLAEKSGEARLSLLGRILNPGFLGRVLLSPST